MTTCNAIGCTNEATHTWSGHPTCDECALPGTRKATPPEHGARRATDRVGTHKSLELLASLAMEQALSRGDPEVISAVETAILRLREDTGTFKTLDIPNDELPMFLRRQAD